MGINRFFTDILGATLCNARWSWGAIAHTTNRVFPAWLEVLYYVRR